MTVVGVLALQGDFPEHLRSLEQAGVDALEVRTKKDLQTVSALILPGGESTTMAKLLRSSGLDQAIRERVLAGMPIWGTCAGAILLAKEVQTPVELESHLGLLDVTIERNAYGRQLESFEQYLRWEGDRFPAYFIRAPRILRCGRGVKVHIRHRGDPVCVQSKGVLASTFHVELGDENPLLRHFLQLVS